MYDSHFSCTCSFKAFKYKKCRLNYKTSKRWLFLCFMYFAFVNFFNFSTAKFSHFGHYVNGHSFFQIIMLKMSKTSVEREHGGTCLWAIWKTCSKIFKIINQIWLKNTLIERFKQNVFFHFHTVFTKYIYMYIQYFQMVCVESRLNLPRIALKCWVRNLKIEKKLRSPQVEIFIFKIFLILLMACDVGLFI